MPVTNPRQAAEWQSRFNVVVRAALDAPLGDRGYELTVDQVVEEVEPDSYGPFYVAEVGWTRPLAGGAYAHILVQSTTQAGSAGNVFYVDLVRNGRATPPHYQDAASPRPEFKARLTDPEPGGSRRDRQGWAFGDAAELRRAADRMVQRLNAPKDGAGATTWFAALEGDERAGAAPS